MENKTITKKTITLLTTSILVASSLAPSLVGAAEVTAPSSTAPSTSAPTDSSSTSSSTTSDSSTTSASSTTASDSSQIDSSITSKNNDKSVTGTIASGTNGTAPWTLDDSGVLTIESGQFAQSSTISYWSSYADSINKIVFDGPVSAAENSAFLFYNLSKVTTIEGLSNFDTSKVDSFYEMFSGCSSLTSLDVSSFDTSNATGMSGMFGRCSSLTSLDLSNFDTSNVLNMGEMFSSCSSLTSLDLSNFDTSNVTNMGQMFNGCSSLTSLDVSSFDTSNVGMAEVMFSNCSSLTSLDVSRFDTSNMSSMYMMFNGCSSLTSLDLSNFDTSQAKELYSFFEKCNSLKELKLGNKFAFINGNGGNAKLPGLTADDKYTGKWQNVGTGSVENPAGDNVWTSDEFMANYNKVTDADTYVWQPKKIPAADVTVNYVDEDGNEVHPAQAISGNIGDKYDASTVQYKLPIDGYTLDESKLPTNAQGEFSNQAQTVTYVYTKNPVKAADVTAKYVDTDGNQISDDVVKSGNVGDDYTTEQKNIEGYTFKEVQGNASGKFTDEAQTVTYVYNKNVTPTPTPVDPVNPITPIIPVFPSGSDTDVNVVSGVDFTVPQSSVVASSTLPQTGDNNKMSLYALFAGIMAITLAAVASVFKLRKNK